MVSFFTSGVATLAVSSKAVGSFVSVFVAQLLLCALPRSRLTVNSALRCDSHFTTPHFPTPYSYILFLLLLLLLLSICLTFSA